ncbi:MAG: hypothetical protein IT162_15275 [Bryobacterales bacterium]|nr:hypothetical protein [Bryobacterales bacterium]
MAWRQIRLQHHSFPLPFPARGDGRQIIAATIGLAGAIAFAGYAVGDAFDGGPIRAQNLTH